MLHGRSVGRGRIFVGRGESLIRVRQHDPFIIRPMVVIGEGFLMAMIAGRLRVTYKESPLEFLLSRFFRLG